MSSQEMSLLGHLDTPVLVGDPDGYIVYANAHFREHFGGMDDDPVGQPLALVFGGGAREVVLSATAQVLERGKAARIQIREGGHSYTGLCSPIEAEDDRVGVVMVMLEEQSNEEHLMTLADEAAEPLAEALQGLQGLSNQVQGSLSEDQRRLLEQSTQSLERAQHWMRELSDAVRGGKVQQGRFDVANSVLRVSERFQQEGEGRVDLQVLMPPNLPRVSGTTVVFERLLSQLIRQRLDEAEENTPLTLLARTMGGDQPRGVLISIVDVPNPDRRDGTGHPPESVQQSLIQMGGEAVCFEDSKIGRVTSMRLAMAAA